MKPSGTGATSESLNRTKLISDFIGGLKPVTANFQGEFLGEVQFWVSHVSMLDDQDENGNTILMSWAATKLGNLPEDELSILVSKKQNFELENTLGETVLDLVAGSMRSNPAAVRVLIDAGAKPNHSSDKLGRETAIFRAVRWNNVEVVQALVAQGACFLVENFRNESPYTVAREKGYRAIQSIFDGILIDNPAHC